MYQDKGNFLLLGGMQNEKASCRGRLAICEYDNASIIKLFTSAGSIYRRTGNHFER